MILFAGLGNPGGKYARNRHNIGFMAVDEIAHRHGFSPWRKRFRGEVAEGRLGTEKVLLLKPQTYMNESGRSVGEAAKFFKIEPEDVYVFHDELDLAAGKLRCKLGGGVAGHNGLRSIAAQMGKDFQRIRMGIGHPGNKAKVLSHVLKDFAKDDQDWLDAMLAGVGEHAPLLAEGNASSFQNKVHLAVNPEPQEKPRKSKEKSKQTPAAKPETTAKVETQSEPKSDEKAGPMASALRKFFGN